MFIEHNDIVETELDDEENLDDDSDLETDTSKTTAGKRDATEISNFE